ncbi:MAG: leucine-rich repeat protein [Clostridiales bacterium]|nr:leucine-rich repeat protein [Clostridiales bacterium]
MKRMIIAAVVAALMLSVCAAGVSAENTVAGDFVFRDTEGGLELVEYNGTETGFVVIPSTVDGKKVVAIGSYAFDPGHGEENDKGHPEVMSVSVPSGVTDIGDRAFYKTGWISSPDSADAYGCIIINGILVKYLGAASEFTAPAKVKVVNYGAFEGNSTLRSVILGDGVGSVLDYAFYKCSALERVSFGKALSYIGDYAFSQSALTSVDLPQNVYSVPRACFKGCASLRMVTAGSVTNIGESAFSGCTSLTSLHFSDGKENVFPRSLRSVEGYAFLSCAIKSLTLGSGVRNIGTCAFADCKDLTDIYINDDTCSAGSIGDYAFGIDLNKNEAGTYTPKVDKNVTVHIACARNADGSLALPERRSSPVIRYCFSPDPGGILPPVAYDIDRTVLLGDADLDGSVTAMDARVALRCAAKLGDAPAGIGVTDLDTDLDGAITASDARMLLRAAARLDTLPESLRA